MTIDERTQEILALRLGMALIGSARLQAENEALQAAAAVKADSPIGARSAEQRTEEQDQDHG